MSALYKQVCQNILHQINRGELQVGEKLPPEAQFAAELGISRSTLRLAFSELEASGVLQRRKRSGTVITGSAPKKKFSMTTTDLNELLSLGRDTTLSILNVSTIEAQETNVLSGFADETGQWLMVAGARSLNGDSTPFSANKVYVPARFAGIEPVLKNTETSVFQVIEDTFDISVGRIKQTTRAIVCPKEEARIMGLKPSTPVLQILAALYATDDSLMEVSVATFDCERFQLESVLELA